MSSWQSGSLTSPSGGPEGTDSGREWGLTCTNERSTISARISVFVGEVSPVFFSLNMLTLRELSLGFGTIKASSWRCSGQLPGVSLVFDRTENYSGGNLFPSR